MTDIPDVLIDNIREALSLENMEPFVAITGRVGTEAAQPMIALWNAAHSIINVADGKPDATLARLEHMKGEH